MLANKNLAPSHFAQDYAPAHMAPKTRTLSLGRSVCYAGIACVLAGSLVPAALADGNPSIGWDPEVPSIDPNEPSGGEEPGGNETPDVPEPPVVDPEPPVEPPVEPEPPVVEPEPEIPDSGTTAPEPDYLYPDGTGSVGGEGAFYDPEYPEDTAPASEEVPNPDATAAAVSVPVFGSYDAATGVLTGSTQPGVTVRVVDGAGNVLGDAVAGEDGVFSIVLPVGTDLATVSVYAIDAEGNPLGEALLGSTMVQEIGRRELEAVRAATGASTVELAERLSSTVDRVKIATFIDMPEEEGMPVLPYAIGAASAVVAVGAVGAGVLLYRRRAVEGEKEQDGPVTPMVPATSAFANMTGMDGGDSKGASAPSRPAGSRAAHDTFANMSPVVASSALGAGAMLSDEPDELELLAMSLAPSRPAGSRAAHDTFANMSPVVASSALGAGAMLSDEPDELELLAMSLHGNETSSEKQPASGQKQGVPTHEHDDDPFPPDGPDGGPGGGMTADPDSTASFLAIMGLGSAAVDPIQEPPRSSDRLDDLAERFGDIKLPTAFMGGAFESDPDVTLISSPSDDAPLDDEAFARLAHILATGSGKIHRVTKSYTDLDLAGLDLVDDAQHTATASVVADPLAVQDDWREVALRELAAPAVQPSAIDSQLSTDDYVALVSTQRREALAEVRSPMPASYVAPVVGPSSLSAAEAARHQAMLHESTAAAAIALKSRDAAFKSRTRGGDSVRQGGFLSGRSSSTDDVPTIVRGGSSNGGPANRTSTLSDRMYLERQSLSVPDPSCFAPVPAAPISAPIRDRGVAAAVAAAQNVYAAYGSPTVGSYESAQAVIPQRSAEVGEVTSSVAAAYAAAVYGSVAHEAPLRSVSDAFGATAWNDGDQFSYREAELAGPVGRPLPAIGSEGDFSDPYDAYGTVSGVSAAYINYMVQDEFEHRHDTMAQRNAALGRSEGDFSDPYDAYGTVSGVSAAYINYMVQDEFEHRHDTMAQRNAALGRLHIVNGAAHAPVPLAGRYRHPA